MAMDDIQQALYNALDERINYLADIAAKLQQIALKIPKKSLPANAKYGFPTGGKLSLLTCANVQKLIKCYKASQWTIQ